MGARGPKPGFKKARAEQAAAAAAPAAPAPVAAPEAATGVACTPEQLAAIPSWHRDHPDKLGGEALVRLGHRMGIPRSDAQRMGDEKLRAQIKMAQLRWSNDSHAEQMAVLTAAAPAPAAEPATT